MRGTSLSFLQSNNNNNNSRCDTLTWAYPFTVRLYSSDFKNHVGLYVSWTAIRDTRKSISSTVEFMLIFCFLYYKCVHSKWHFHFVEWDCKFFFLFCSLCAPMLTCVSHVLSIIHWKDFHSNWEEEDWIRTANHSIHSKINFNCDQFEAIRKTSLMNWFKKVFVFGLKTIW